MAQSHTQKKSNKVAPPVVRQVTDVATNYITHWTRKELGRIQQESSPICIPIKGGYKIGLYTLKTYTNKTCQVYDHNGEQVHLFENKISAVLYTIYTIKKRYWLADEILALDREINKNYVDMLALRRSTEKARERKDYNKVDINLSRLDIVETKLTLARDKISKIHKSAKYNKVWE
jgi:hypothetical protein